MRLALIAMCLVLAGLIALLTRSRSSQSSHDAQHNVLAPDFSLQRLDGTNLSLSSYRGNVVLLDFWATWCAPCREETPHLVELQQKYGDQGLQIIGVSMDDSPDPVGPFYREFHMNYPVVMGTAHTGELYGGVLGLPIAFLIDREGRIYRKHLGATDVQELETEVKELLQAR